MEVRKILTVGRSNGSNMLTAPHIVPHPPGSCRNDRKMIARSGARRFPRWAFAEQLSSSPQPAPPSRAKQNTAISNGVNWIAYIGIFPADAVEIVAEMMIFGESLRVIGQRTVLAAERKIEALRGWK